MSQKKFSLWTLLKGYDKVEIPIIQRDYAQGRVTKEVNKIRKNFIGHLVDNLLEGNPIELDFVYGMVRDGLFIPLDGQQRLTTLFLLHWYIAYRENKLEPYKDILLKFTYETRASSHDFMSCLCKESHPQVTSISDYIKAKAYWFDNDWLLDPSVSGMLIMIQTLENHKELNDNLGCLFDRLISDELLISFYFLPLEEFGLSDDLYIRMNARGKILNEFENFKSNFYRIIKDCPNIDRIKTKMEYDWVTNLWEYRTDPKNEFVVDTYFMNYLEFITKMIYYHHYYSGTGKSDVSFRDFDTFKDIYQNNEHTKFLEFCFDIIPTMRNALPKQQWLWDKESSLADILKNCMHKGNAISIDETFILYGALLFCYKNNQNTAGLEDYIRVIRNLIFNTGDKSEREWEKIIPSTEKLIYDNSIPNMSVFKQLLSFGSELEGFYVPQKNEEILKSSIRADKGDAFAVLIEQAEDNNKLQGRILPLLKACYSDDEDWINNKGTTDFDYSKLSVQNLEGILSAYEQISKDDFNIVWGDLINTKLYTYHRLWRYNYEVYDLCKCIYNDDYRHHSSTITLAKSFWQSQMDLNTYINYIEARFISKIDDIRELPDMKSQLYALYIISKQVCQKKHWEFFRNGYNFGCTTDKFDGELHKPFKQISDTEIKRPIYQTYGTQFQYNRGVLHQRIPLVYWKDHNSYIKKIKNWADQILKKE